MTLHWLDIAQEFAFDGSWLDVVVLETSLTDWDAVLAALRAAQLQTMYCIDGAEMTLPPPATAFFASTEYRQLLKVSGGTVGFNCHFFTMDEIEFDLDPREVTSQAALDEVLGFMAMIAGACHKPALLTPENVHDDPILRVRSGCAVEYFPPPKEDLT
ncbi:MAG TPA: hypothetical protein PLJ23_00080 [Gemmatimonadales bacterium]|nr:hypothetical protein [Gemmatimonadales bacterium]